MDKITEFIQIIVGNVFLDFDPHLMAGYFIQLLKTTFKDVESVRIISLSALHMALKSNFELTRD